MTRPSRRALLPALLLLLAVPVVAAEVTVHSVVDAQKLGVEDVVQLTITVSGPAVDDIPMPALTNLRVVGGPSISNQVSFINGAVSQSRSATYVLQPQAPGKAEIGAVTVKMGAEPRVAPPIELEVVAGKILERRRRDPDPFDPFGGEDPLQSLMRRRRGPPPPEPKVLLEAAVNRNRVYVGEPVLLTYYIYTQTQVSDLRVTESPKYGGAWTEDLPQPKQAQSGEPATVNGDSYRRIAVDQKLLFPTKAGTITIPPLTAQLGVSRGGGLLDPFPGSTVIERSTRPITITVLPIPETPEFSGAVGQFTASTTLDKQTVAIGDAATLRFEVKGAGNLKWVDKAPELSIAGAKVYPPQVKSDLKTTPDGIAGTKTWEFIVVPETGGAIAIPSLAFSFFDPRTGQLAKAVTAPLDLQAVGAAAAAGGAQANAPSVAHLSEPLALRSDLDLPNRAVPPIGPRVLALVAGVVLLAHAAFFAGAWLRRRERGASGRPAPARDVRRVLAELSRAGHNGLSKEAAVALIERTLHEVFGPLEEGGPETERERAARQVLQEVYFIRYAPQLGDYSEKIREVARRAEAVVRRYA